MVNILITGGTGSLGSKLVLHYLEQGYSITVLSRDEDKQSRMMNEYPEVKFILGDIRNYETCKVATIGQDVVIHAAALKRIEFGETDPWECIQTNVIGTRNMVNACLRNSVLSFVFISTDKACKPINVYGMCKALGERIVTKAGYNCVRYGNVNNSRGSVLPYWKKCKEEKKRITVTNPNMTRFLIDFDEAIKMIEIALEKMNGCIYVPKLDSANIFDLAKLFSPQPMIMGERPGEKLHEELINGEEFRGRVEEFNDYYKLHRTIKFKEMDMSYSSCDVKQLRGDELREKLKEFL